MAKGQLCFLLDYFEKCKLPLFFSDDDENEDESGSESWETESEHSVADEGKVAKTEDDDKKGGKKYQLSRSKMSQKLAKFNGDAAVVCLIIYYLCTLGSKNFGTTIFLLNRFLYSPKLTFYFTIHISSR